MAVNVQEAEAVREELEQKLGGAVELVSEAVVEADKLAKCFAGDPEYADEHKQATKWHHALLFNPLGDLLSEVGGDAPSTDDDAPVQVLMERKKVEWVKRAIQLVRSVESADFQQDACDEVILDLEHSLS